jgi:transposase
VVAGAGGSFELLPPEVQAEGADAYVRIGEEITETLEWRAGSYVRFQIVRPKFAKKAQPEAGVLTADLPPRAIERGLAGPGLLAQVLVRKHADSLPLNRQESIFARDGIDLARSTMCEWVQACGELFGCVVDAMAVDSKQTAPYLAVDATGVLVQAPEQCRRGHFWVLIAPGSHVLFRFTPRHTRDGPKAFFRDYRGYVVADAATVYDELYRTEQVTEVGCWASSSPPSIGCSIASRSRLPRPHSPCLPSTADSPPPSIAAPPYDRATCLAAMGSAERLPWCPGARLSAREEVRPS